MYKKVLTTSYTTSPSDGKQLLMCDGQKQESAFHDDPASGRQKASLDDGSTKVPRPPIYRLRLAACAAYMDNAKPLFMVVIKFVVHARGN